VPASANNNNTKSSNNNSIRSLRSGKPLSSRDDNDDSDDIIKSVFKKNEQITTIDTIEEEPYHKENDEEAIEMKQDHK
jgi:hypothetical protein